MMAYTFSQTAFDTNDLRAKIKFKDLFSKHPKFKNLTLKDPENPYTVDFYVYENNEHIANIEVEVKNSWKTATFPYKDIQLLTRKRKFWFDDNDNIIEIPTMFVMFNTQLTNHLAIPSGNMVDIYRTNQLRSYGNGYGPAKARSDDLLVADISNALIDVFNA